MKRQTGMAVQKLLIDALAALLTREGKQVRLFETHISWVLVTDAFAYKFKKAVKYAFLDFSTLRARRYYCMEELRLNRRFSPALYLDLIRITGRPDRPSMNGAGKPIEYGVMMRTFPQQALWSSRLDTGAITVAEIDALAHLAGRFHCDAARAADDNAWGGPDAVRAAAHDNLGAVAALIGDADGAAMVRDIGRWQAGQCDRLADAFEARKTHGFIRECHGDLHSGNILTLDGVVSLFDCIEFDESLRWIDVMDDVSFICMDLSYRQRHELAVRLLNRYLDTTGDYEGLGVFGFYRTGRALVRCKVALLRNRQAGGSAGFAGHDGGTPLHYLRFALESTRPCPTAVMIMHGFSGSGKSTLAEHLADAFGAVRLRSDTERKRMLGLPLAARAPAPPDSAPYDPATTARLYDRLRHLARHVVVAGLPVVVDASFLKRAQRNLFKELANDLDVPFVVFSMRAGECLMRERIVSRSRLHRDPSDAGLDTLAHQLATSEPLSGDETNEVVYIGGDWAAGDESLRSGLVTVFDKMRARTRGT